jgi:hypothetical protein
VQLADPVATTTPAKVTVSTQVRLPVRFAPLACASTPMTKDSL